MYAAAGRLRVRDVIGQRQLVGGHYFGSPASIIALLMRETSL